MSWLIEFFQKNPLIPIFITLGLGFQLGKVRIKSFSLGSVAATLIVGVIIGQMKINVPDVVKNVFFLFFLFATGYGVGPQFFRSFRGPGVKIVGFAVVEALVCAGLVIVASYLMGYGKGVASGLFAGSQTVSASLGLLSDTVRELPLAIEEKSNIILLIPACYAVTYVLGTVGTAWFLSSVAPCMMGGKKKVLDEIARIEQTLDQTGKSSNPGIIAARRPVEFRAYKADSDFFDTSRTLEEIEKYYASHGARIMVERARIDGKIVNCSDISFISKNDIIVLGGRAEDMVALQNAPGEEVTDPELLNFGAEKTPITIASKKGDGLTLDELREKEFMESVIIASVKRNGLSIPVKSNTELHGGDVITLVGWPSDVAKAANALGYPDRATDSTDMVFVGLGIAAGCIIGALTIKINGIPMSLGASVGALLSGLILGWLRVRKPSFGHIPSSALWIFNNLGINMFIAVLGITAGGALLHGIKEAGIMIIAVGFALTIIGLVINILLAHKVFKFSSPDTLGCVAGGRCCVAAIGAINDSVKSDVPNLSFTITYAVANVSLVFSSLLVLFLT